MRHVLFAAAVIACSACASSAGGRRARDGGLPGPDAGGDAARADTGPDGRASDAAGDASDTVDGGTTDARPADDADGLADAGPDGAAPDAATPDAGCAPGTSRPCTLTCASGTTATGRETCIGGDAWSACERRPEMCGNGIDDDGDGAIDEDCRLEGECIWIRPQCQGVMTLNAWCAAAGGRHLVAGRRCPVAGGATVPLDAAYGAFPLCCCDVASMCVPECEDPSCSSCVVWDEIQCCP